MKFLTQLGTTKLNAMVVVFGLLIGTVGFAKPLVISCRAGSGTFQLTETKSPLNFYRVTGSQRAVDRLGSRAQRVETSYGTSFHFTKGAELSFQGVSVGWGMYYLAELTSPTQIWGSKINCQTPAD